MAWIQSRKKISNNAQTILGCRSKETQNFVESKMTDKQLMKYVALLYAFVYKFENTNFRLEN